jgi:hypothetical protein
MIVARFGFFVLVLVALILPTSAIAQPVLSVSPTSFTLTANVGTNLPNQAVTIRNAGNQALRWSIASPTANWLSVSPTSGVNSGTLTLTLRTSALAGGTYQGSFAVRSSTGSSMTVTVGVTMVAPTSTTTAPATFSGTTAYVSTSGSDTNAGTQTSPVRTIQRGVAIANQVNATGQASRVLIAAGVYREAVDLNGQQTDAALVIEGAGASTILTGADNWSTSWTPQSDGSYVRAWPYAWGMKPIPSGWESYWNWDGNGYKRDALRRSEMVYVNGRGLLGVLSRSGLVAGTFHVDESARLIYLRLPSGVSMPATIEVGVRLTPLRINGRRNVTLRNFAVMRNRGAVQDNGVNVTNSRNITLEGITVSWMAYSGYSGSNNTTIRIRRSAFNDNGVSSVGQYRDVDVAIEDSEIARNNWRGWPAEHKGWSTGHKWSGIRDGAVRRTRFTNNWGHGFWADSDNKRVSLEYSLVSGNSLNGVNVEKNQGPITILNNRICNNTQAGLSDAQSDNVTVRNNQIWGSTRWNWIFTGNYSGQTIRDWQSGASITTRSLYWTVVGNTIAGSGSEGWLFWHTGADAWRQIRSTMVQVDNNRWSHSARTTAFRMPQGSVTYPAFVTDLQLSKPLSELNSSWQTTPALSCTMP